jgi:DNA helicase II / ATP-dependent DNA helicase PcrA
VANAIRRDGDGLVQTRGRTQCIDGKDVPVAGNAHIFVLPTSLNRNELLARVQAWAANTNRDPLWLGSDESSVKMLVIVHRMAATRLGFGDLYAAMNDKAPDEFKNGFLDATAWPLRALMRFALPLSAALQQRREFEAMSLLRQYCDLLQPDQLRAGSVSRLLTQLREASVHLSSMTQPATGNSVRSVLLHLRDSKLISLDPRMLSYLQGNLPTPNSSDNDESTDGEEVEREITAMEAFLSCPVDQLWGYRRYLADQSPFSTQQGIKGAEFPRVLVVLDDEEGTHTQFSYDKYFKIKPPSERDQQNIQGGKETVVDRTRRLFYVCCTRATQDLVVVLFSSEPDLAEQRVREAKIFQPESILRSAALRDDLKQ